MWLLKYMNAISVWEEPQTVQSSSTAVFSKHLQGLGELIY